MLTRQDKGMAWHGPIYTTVSDIYFNVSMKIIEEITFQINSFTFILVKPKIK